ncbi:MAG: HAD family phosphatase [Clostridia bacterium]|nr:HAD family phosphatase [Clostridia bacterium]
MIENIVFDMGGVLINYDPEGTIYGIFDKEVADIALKEIFRNRLWNEKDRGTVTPDEIMERVRDKIPPRAYDKVSEITHNLYPYMKPFEETCRLVRELKRNGYGIFLLSNASDDFFENKWRIPALEYFDGYLISADYKLLKPEPEIYSVFFEKFNLNPSECFFIDDMPANVEGSEKAGMKAYCFNHKDFALLRNALRENGINI